MGRHKNKARQLVGQHSAHLQSGRILSCPPTSHTVKLMFLYSTVSTLKPMVGMVVTISPSLSLYRMVVFPAASRPTMRIRISFLEKRRLNTLWKAPIVADGGVLAQLSWRFRRALELNQMAEGRDNGTWRG